MRENTDTVERQRCLRLYAAAQEARGRGDDARAYALLEELLPLLEPAGELHSKHVVLAQMAGLLEQAKSHVLAIELWCQAVPLAEAQGDLLGASLMLDKVAQTHASEGAWRSALQRWQQALELDTRLGNAHNRAATLANMASAAAHVGDKLQADRFWSEALTTFESSGKLAQASAIVRAMQAIAIKTGDFSDPLEVRARFLRMAVGADDREGQVLALDGLAHAALQLKRTEQAIGYFRRALALADGFSDDVTSRMLRENIAQCQADLQGEKRTPNFPSEPRRYGSVSEYDVQADAAPFFLVGELWAALHARGVLLRSLADDAISISPAGMARLSPNVRLTAGPPLAAEATAEDLSAALERRSPAGAAALLAGYARGAYELLDHDQPGFTDTLLDRFGVPEPRPRPQQALNVEELFAALGVQLRASDGQLWLSLVQKTGPSTVWQRTPELAFQFMLGLRLASVDCRALWERDAATAWPAFELLLPLATTTDDLEQQTQRMMELIPPGLELAGALAQMLRGLSPTEQFAVNHALPWARRVLTTGPEAQAMQLGDILIDVALYCAKLEEPSAALAAASHVQLATMLFEYTARGQRSDEARLLTILRAFAAQPAQHPSPLGPWPTDFGPWLWHWNSLLIALRELTSKSVAAQERGQVGVLRSAALRGVRVARHVLRVSYAAAGRRDPEIAAAGLPLLRLTIKNYVGLLWAFFESVRLEQETTGNSAWRTWIDRPSGPPHLARELQWALALFAAAAEEGFSLDAARTFMGAGAEFCSDENTYLALPAERAAPALN